MTKKKLIDERYVSRRQFLIGGGSTLLLPPLLSLWPQKLAAQYDPNKKVRTVLYAGKWGIDPHQFFPTDPTDMRSIPGAAEMRYRRLNSFSGPLSRVIDSSFSPIYDYMNVINGLSHTSGKFAAHNKAALSGAQSKSSLGTSIDNIIANSSSFYKNATPRYKSVVISSGSHEANQSYISQDGKTITSNYIMGDGTLFNKLFSNVFPPGENVMPDHMEKTNELLVDRIYGDLKKLQSNKRISKNDKNLLERYVASVHDVQKKVQLFNSGFYRCPSPDLNINQEKGSSGEYISRSEITDFDIMFANYNELIKIAFMCDLTRVVVIGNSIWSSTNKYHRLHHDCESSEKSADRQAWGLKKMRDLAVELRNQDDPLNDGNLLDNSVILCTNELGQWNTGHAVKSMPVITYGKAGGFFNTGYYLDCFRKSTSGKSYGPYGRPYKQILQSIMLSMGIPKSEYIKYGDENGFGQFVNHFTFRNRNFRNVYGVYNNTHNDAIPFITNS